MKTSVKPERESAKALRKRVETTLAKRVGGLASLSPEDVLRLAHELEVHRVELETQNDELQSARDELERSRDRYADLYDFAPVAYATFDEAGRLIEVNLTGEAMVGVGCSLLVGRPFLPYVEPADHSTFSTHVRTSDASPRA